MLVVGLFCDLKLSKYIVRSEQLKFAIFGQILIFFFVIFYFLAIDIEIFVFSRSVTCNDRVRLQKYT